jgi:hypothetical protein
MFSRWLTGSDWFSHGQDGLVDAADLVDACFVAACVVAADVVAADVVATAGASRTAQVSAPARATE